MNADKIKNFDDKVKAFFLECNIDLSCVRLGVAVSGGADSVSLLTSLSHIVPVSNLFAITVNHSLRPASETDGDADYVESYCRNLGVKCRRVNIKRGYIRELAEKRKEGIEEAARYVRYDAFKSFIIEEKLDFLCLAHNRNDQIETMIMRFLSGSSSGSLSGIPKIRDKYIRPLYYTPRSEIESYLEAQDILYRTDKTNFDTAMFRNTIRNIIVPVLNENVPGFDSALFNLAKKSADDEDFIKKKTDQILKTLDYREISKDELLTVSINADRFIGLDSAIKRRILYQCLNRVGSSGRIPYSFIERIMKYGNEKKSWHEQTGSVEVRRKDDAVYIGLKSIEATEKGFYAIIRKEGCEVAGNFALNILKKDKGIFLENKGKNIFIEGLDFPFLLRSVQSGDCIENADNNEIPVSKIITDWNGGEKRFDFIVVQKLDEAEESIKALIGSFAGYEDWIVK